MKEFIMNKIILCVLGVVPFVLGNAECPCKQRQIYDKASEIPEVTIPEFSSLKLIPDVAQYKFADWSNVIGISRGITRAEAMWIASQNPEITFFFWTKGYQMVLETQDGEYRVFGHGDAVFFTGEPWWGTAPGLADGYIKQPLSN